MCGIAGIVAEQTLSPTARAHLERMQFSMRHRGPDDGGEYSAGNLLLAHRRLSIIDLAGGRQPMFNETGDLVLVANAEIYNYLELRTGLLERGHALATDSDCEVILHLYEEHGCDCVEHLRGMFAFALWDHRRRQLLLARDRLGEKPLYYHQQRDRLLFASEMKALLASQEIACELSPGAVDQYLHYQYVPEPLTAIAGVRKLRAGHMLQVSVTPWAVRVKRYWRLPQAPSCSAAPAEAISRKLHEAGELVTRADVPLGVALSGGLDSSLVACLAARHSRQPVTALSVGYPGRPEYDERAQAAATAKALGIAMREAELPTADFARELPTLVRAMDDPVADIAACGHLALMRLAREQGIKVLLFGLGGDELFWGYPWLGEAIRLTRGKRALPRRAAMLLRRSSAWLYRPALFRWGHHRRLPAFMRRLCAALWRTGLVWGTDPRAVVAENLLPPFNHASYLRARLFTPAFRSRIPADNALAPLVPAPGEDTPDAALAVNQTLCATWLQGNCLALADRLGMSCSVETRLPLLEPGLVELVIGLRKATPDHALAPKQRLRAAAAGLVPEQVLARPKRGFRPPVEEWIGQALRAYDRLLRSGVLVQRGVLRAGGVAEALQAFYNKGAYGFVLYKLLVLELWCREVMLRQPVEPLPA